MRIIDPISYILYIQQIALISNFQGALYWLSHKIDTTASTSKASEMIQIYEKGTNKEKYANLTVL